MPNRTAESRVSGAAPIGGMVPEREYLDDRELARRTPLARATWQKMRHEGKGPPVRRVGRRCLYLWSEVVAWIESQREGAAA